MLLSYQNAYIAGEILHGEAVGFLRGHGDDFKANSGKQSFELAIGEQMIIAINCFISEPPGNFLLWRF